MARSQWKFTVRSLSSRIIGISDEVLPRPTQVIGQVIVRAPPEARRMAAESWQPARQSPDSQHLHGHKEAVGV